MSKAAGAKKPSESQKAKAIGRTTSRLDLWEEHLKDPIWKKKTFTVPGEPLPGLAIGSKRKVVRTAMACSDVGTKILQEMWEGTFWEGVWPCLDPWDSVRLCTVCLPIGTSRGSMGRTASPFSSLSRMSWWWLQTTCRPTPLSLRKRSWRVRCR